ncbi:MAG: amidohydrolase [Longimicrobiales bacterium]|nr:amidohydrolase [Longimicrobiales bacterium]
MVTTVKQLRGTLLAVLLAAPVLLAISPACAAAQSGAAQASTAQVEPADMILHSGRLWTGVEEEPYAEALAIRGDEIVAVGDDAQVMALQGEDTRMVDLAGRFVSPGFIDNHTHFNRAGELLLGVNLLEVSDAEGLTRAVGDAAERLPDGAWMTGGMWGAYEQWAMSSTGREGADSGGELFRPDRSLIDPVSPRNPAILWNWDRSQYLANGAALAAAEIRCGEAGVECRDGEPTGRVSAEVAARIQDAIPDKTMEQKLAEARIALARLAEHGVTTFFDITPPEQVEVYDRLRKEGELTSRVNMRLVLDTWDEMRDAGIVEGFGDRWVRYQGLKGFVDGIMGGSSARFYEPYLTTGVRGEWRDARNTGYVTDDGSGFMPQGNMRALVLGADAAGFNPRVHAIGDEAIDRILDIYAEVADINGPREGRRFAIIHNQVIRGPETARRQAELGIIAEMQPYHTIDAMRWMEERIGERGRWAYAFKTLHDAGVMLSFGSDWPGTNAAWYTSNPLHGIYAAVTRETLDGTPEGGWFPQEKIDVETALRAYTVNNAYAAGEEEYKGKLAPGFLADIAVLDRDPFAVDPSELKDIRVMLTVVDGQVVFQRPST